MCGIAGILNVDGAPARLDELRRMADVLHHRGPDDEGFYRAGPVGLAHRRLSIIDLESGHQPMESADGRLCVVFNGEIYNFQELREELKKKGHAFRTRSDTEVLLAAYREHGVGAFEKLNGMFACAIWDEREHRLVLARDRLGKKPLFYHWDGRRFLFASELKALLAHGGIERRVSSAALHDYLTHSYIAGEHSIIEGVSRLPPAHFLVVQRGDVSRRRYWELAMEPADPAPSEEEALERLEALMAAAVRRRLVSDVPLGAFLSGGLDSSAVVAWMTELTGRPVATFTVGFEEREASELDDARAVAEHLGTDHREIVVKPAAVDMLPDLVWHLDEPFGDSSALPTYQVCRAARQHVTVALSGDGGDETFAGYTHYQELGRYRRMQAIPGAIRRSLLRPMSAGLPFTWPGWNYLHAMGAVRDGAVPSGLGIYPFIQERLYMSDFAREVEGIDAFAEAGRILERARHLDPVSAYQYLDTQQYLPADILTKVDRMSMATSLEVRSPLLDPDLVAYVATLPLSLKLRDGVSKFLLRKACARRLPASVLTKPKQGFAIPKDRWFQSELRPFAEELLLERQTLARGYFRADTLRRLLAHHAKGGRDYSTWIWCLIVLELWFRKFLNNAEM